MQINQLANLDIIKLKEINNLCISIELSIDKKQRKTGSDIVETCLYLTECVDFDNFD